jgi:indolepyruvate ferredoxin oxidoreductase alpha subunit
MGNQALALGALRAGVNLVSGYPGTPSTECLEHIAYLARQQNLKGLHVEWSTNEKAALEIAAGAAMSGARALATMKQVGLNVALDAMMSLPYLGLSGLVLLVADDPGPFSSQTEQDTRQIAEFIKVPLLDPSTPEEALEMMSAAFEISEEFSTPVIVRPVTRVSHGAVDLDASLDYQPHPVAGFDSKRNWVVLPGRAYLGHTEIVERMIKLTAFSSTSPFNHMEQTGPSSTPAHLGIVAGGLSWAYLKDAIAQLGYVGQLRLLKVGMPVAFPDSLALKFLNGLSEVLVFEELDSVIERRLLELVGRQRLPTKIFGRQTKTIGHAGESSTTTIAKHVLDFLSVEGAGKPVTASILDSAPPLPPRPPMLCAGCPHRASFYAVKQALKGRKANFSGDIGCYTLGSAVPLKMVETCVCMGSGFTVPQGMAWAEPDAVHIGFLGDSTFFASGITGVVNAVYNQANVTLVVLNNSLTAMTGGQPHAGTGERMAAEQVSGSKAKNTAADNALGIATILKACGVACVIEADPLDQKVAIEAIKQAVDFQGTSAVVFSSPCINIMDKAPALHIDPAACNNCKRCVFLLGCPALLAEKPKVRIDSNTCNGCGLCAQVCPKDAIGEQP